MDILDYICLGEGGGTVRVVVLWGIFVRGRGFDFQVVVLWDLVG